LQSKLLLTDPMPTPRLIAFLAVVLFIVMPLIVLLGISLGWFAKSAGPTATSSDEIVLYTSIDEPIARKVLDAFERESGLRVRLVTDTEASRSVGIAEKLRAEKERRRADVWWGNEPFHTLRLSREGFFKSLDADIVEGIDPIFIGRDRHWTGVGVRLRVLAIAPEATTVEPSRNAFALDDLTDPKWKGKLVMARPNAGTTAAQMAALYSVWGQPRFDAWLRGLRANDIALVGGNSIVTQEIAASRFAIGLTDNDDITATQAGGGVLEQSIPDQASASGNPLGTLAIPTTVAVVDKSDSRAEAVQLVRFLTSPRTETILREGGFTIGSTRLQTSARDETTSQVRFVPMSVDYERVADVLPEAVRRATAILEGREP
jgi:iron(III) transport system substrate-binding protein